MSMAMLTPAQKPRGLARITFMRVLLGHPYPTGPIANCKLQIENLHTKKPLRRCAPRVFNLSSEICNLRLLIELDLLDGDDLLLVGFLDGAGDGAGLGGGADSVVIVLVALGIEIIGDVLLVLGLDDDDGRAFLANAEVALGASNRALEDDFFLVLL